MGGSSGSQTIGHKIYLGELLHFCLGPVDQFIEIRFENYTAYYGANIGETSYTINREELFGGDKQEGGVSGVVNFLDGSITQGQNSYLVNAIGDANLPAFRGIAGIVFNKLYLGTNPFLKSVSSRIKRISKQNREGDTQWYPSKSEIQNDTYVIYGGGGIVWENLTSTVGFGLNSGGGTARINCVASYGDIFVIGTTGGYASRSTDAGVTWSALPRYLNCGGAPSQLNHIAFNSNGVGVAVFSGGYASRTEDGGATWSAITPQHLNSGASGGVDCKAVACNGDVFVVVFEAGYAARSTDGGVTWSALVRGLNSGSANTLFNGIASDGNQTFIAIGSFRGGRSTDNGVTWSATPNGLGNGVDASSGSGGIKGTAHGVFIVSRNSSYFDITRDGGANWESLPRGLTSGDTNNSTGGVSTDGYGTWVVTFGDKACRSTDDGENWENLPNTLGVGSASGSDIANNGQGIWVAVFSGGRSARSEAKSFDMNPAHILRELHVNKDYGMSIPAGELDDTVWQSSADTLFDEGFGLSFLWDREMEVQEFRDEVLRHIDGAIILNRQTGLLELRLVRNDYTVGSLETFDYSNIKEIIDYKDPESDGLVNTLTIKFTEPVEDEEDSVTVSDPALYKMQGYEVSETISYPGIMSKSLASRVADRDLKTLSYPIKEIKFKSKYSIAGSYHVTDVFILNLPDKKINNSVFRIVEIDYGDGLNNDVGIFAVEDIFSIEDTGLINLPDTEFTEIISDPQPCPETMAIEAPYLLLVRNEGQTSIDSRLSSSEDIGFILCAGSKPNGGMINGSIYVNTGSGYINSGTFDFCSSAELDTNVTKDPTDNTFDITNATTNVPENNTLLKINNEIMLVTTFSTSSIVVKRGVLDTIPQEHSIGDPILFFEGFTQSDGVEYVDSESIDVKLTPANSRGEISITQVIEDNIIFNSRAIRPYPPGNFQINSNYYPSVIDDSSDITISWAHRDRTQQTGGTVYGNTDGNIGPETDTEYNIRIYDETDSLIRTYSGLTGTSQVYDVSTEQSDSSLNRANFSLRIELESIRDTYVGWQIYNHTFLREITILDRDLTAPPGGETTGDVYLIAATATGDWAGQDGNIATYNGAGWDFTTPITGWRLNVSDEAISIQYNGTTWDVV